MADPGIQPPYLDPSQYPAYIDLQRKQMLAQALMQNTQQSAQNPQDWNSMRVVPHRSALSNVATLASALMAGKANNAALGAQKDYFQGMMGGQPAAAPQAPPSPPPTPGILPPNGVPGSQGPPGPAAPSAGGSPGAPPTSGLLPPQPQAPNPMLIPGMSRQQAQAALTMAGPQEYGKALMAQYAPTDMEKTLRAAGIDPASGLGRQILQQTVAKQNYIAPIEQRANSVERDPLTNAVIGLNPDAAPGATNLYNPQGQLTGQAPVPGGMAAIAQSNAAKTAGAVSQTPLEAGVDAAGRKVYEFPTPPALGAGGAQSGATGVSGASGAGQTASGAVLQAQKTGAEAGQNYASELSKNATGATEVRRSLSELKNLASQATPGAMNEGKMKLGSYMIAAGASPQTVAGWLGVDVGALQAAQKQTATLAVNTIHSMTSRGTNFDLETFMRNNPNMNMSDPSSFQRVVDYMDNKSKQEIAKQKDFVAWKKGISPDEWESGHTAHWLEQQNQAIDAGHSNSRPPLSSFMRPD